MKYLDVSDYILLTCISVLICTIAYMHNTRKTTDYPIEGTYKVLNYHDLPDSGEAYIWEFSDSLRLYTSIRDSVPVFTQPYIYDQFPDVRYLYLIGYEYQVVYDERGVMQLHQIGGEYPYECYHLEYLGSN